jgi:hypothetical protein
MKRFLLVSVTAVILTVSPNAFATVVDLVNGTSDVLNGALYLRGDIAPAGTGNIDSFVRLNPGGSVDFEQGYNTSFRPVQYVENTDPNFTRALPLSVVPTVVIAGTICASGCKEFLLDINQSGDSLITLNRVVISLRPAGNLAGASVTAGTRLGAGAGLFTDDTLVYDSLAGNQIQLDADFSAGSGKGDMHLYVPTSLFTGPNTFVYLYSEFGALPGDTACAADPVNPMPACYANANSGFEEWAVRGGFSTVPEPTSLVLLGAGLIGLAVARKRNA